MRPKQWNNGGPTSSMAHSDTRSIHLLINSRLLSEYLMKFHDIFHKYTELFWFHDIIPGILEVGVMSHAQIRYVVLGCLASFSLFIMFNLCACNVCENRHTITKISQST